MIDLKDIISITGKPGLFRIVAQTGKGVIVESLDEKKTRMPVQNNYQVALLEEIYRGHPMTQEAWVSFNQIAGANLNIQVVHWWKGTDYQKYLAGMQEMNLEVKTRFDAEGIGFA